MDDQTEISEFFMNDLEAWQNGIVETGISFHTWMAS